MGGGRYRYAGPSARRGHIRSKIRNYTSYTNIFYYKIFLLTKCFHTSTEIPDKEHEIKGSKVISTCYVIKCWIF